MAISLFDDVPLKAKIIGWSVIIAPLAILVLLGSFFLRPAPIKQELVWGCYTASDAPALLIKNNAVSILDGTQRSLIYIAEPYKEGYRLSVSPALVLTTSRGGQSSFEQRRGIGYFWPLLAIRSDNPRRMRVPDDFGGRIDVAAEGRSAIYVRSQDSKNCQ